MGTSPRIADHVETAAEVSELLLTTYNAMRTYWGRTVFDRDREIVRAEALQLKAEAAQIRARANTGGS